jgi:hypothetical protein
MTIEQSLESLSQRVGRVHGKIATMLVKRKFSLMELDELARELMSAHVLVGSLLSRTANDQSRKAQEAVR